MATETTTENEIYIAKLHWIIFCGPAGLLLLGMILGILSEQLHLVSIFLVGFALVWGLMNWVNYYFSSVTIRPKQVILQTGVLLRKYTDIPMNKIETIDIQQSILGSIFHYGTLMITGTGGTRHFIVFLDKPLTCRRYIEQMMHQET